MGNIPLRGKNVKKCIKIKSFFKNMKKYKIVQDKKYISDFDRLLLGTENLKKK